jgi:FkbM family methyltransferase
MDSDYRIININGITMYLFGDRDLISDDIINDNNFWEYRIFEKWKPYFPSTGLMLDIGANIGNHCLMFHDSFPELKIMAFEMSYNNFKLLKKNVSPYSHRIDAFNIAVSDSVKVIYHDDSYDQNNGGLCVKTEGTYSNLSIPLDSLPLPQPVTFIKIDIEAHELYAYRGMKELLMRDKPLIWAEDWVHSGHVEGESSIQYLLDLGYEIVDNLRGDFLLKFKN